MNRPPRTVATVAGQIVTELSAPDLPVLSVVGDAFFDDRALQRRMASSLDRPYRFQQPTAFGDKAASPVLQIALVVVNGIAAGAFTEATAESGGPVGRWLARRRLAWRLRRLRATGGMNAPVPVVSDALAAQVGAHARRMGRRSGLSEKDADRFVDGLTTSLTGR